VRTSLLVRNVSAYVGRAADLEREPAITQPATAGTVTAASSPIHGDHSSFSVSSAEA
jgi:hypothetical protein